MTDSPQRDIPSGSDRPAMSDHPELETDDVPQTVSIDNDGGRSPLMIAGVVAFIIVVIIVILIVL